VFERLGATVTKRVSAGLGHAVSPEAMTAAKQLLDAVE